jgi:hypothetical protein
MCMHQSCASLGVVFYVLIGFFCVDLMFVCFFGVDLTLIGF